VLIGSLNGRFAGTGQRANGNFVTGPVLNAYRIAAR
jgi:hypothetical protein